MRRRPPSSAVPELIIFDVGHGNAALYQNETGCVVIDGGPDETLAGFFQSPMYIGPREIVAIFVSHGDEDHLRGVLRLLENNPDLRVGQMFVNPDQQRDTALWQSFSDEVRRLESQGTVIVTSLTRSYPGTYALGPCTFEILSPPPGRILKAANSNTWSAVIRIVQHEHPVALLTADMDRTTLMELLEEGADLRADYLVFPHHGGRPKQANPERFARDLILAVRPTTVLFSIGRKRFDNPLPTILKGVLAAAGKLKLNVDIACTQLASACSNRTYPDREVDPHSAGAYDGTSCAGTLRIPLKSPESTIKRNRVILRNHRKFVDLLVASEERPRCRKTNP